MYKKLNSFDFISNVDSFYNKCRNDNAHRYRSFDYCYYYFRSNIGHINGDNMESSCMHLWAYLASWGMLRGSSKLLQLNPAALCPLIDYINAIPATFWSIDINDYPSNYSTIIKIYQDIENKLENILSVTPTDTLITKIMLGVFGNIPAFDQYFKKSFKEWLNMYNLRLPGKFSEKTLNLLYLFYKTNKIEIDNYPDIPVLPFSGSRSSKFVYSKAKLIDMWGFQKGMN